MTTINVQASHSYNILVDKGIIKNTGDYVQKVTNSKKFALITDDNVDKYYSKIVIDSLTANGLSVCKYIFPHGELSKNFNTLNEIYGFLANNHITRSDSVIALGGGVTGDMAGYAAATFLRGINYIQIPTTLLAQVDSSVGGKTAIDLSFGKNMVGAFKQPLVVICDIETLKTLPKEFIIDGMGEVLKYGMISSASLFETLLSSDISQIHLKLPEIITECITIKKNIVEADEFEKSERMLLNFGHTFGHAIEKYYNFTGISHGKAVAIGMYLITKAAVKNKLCNNDTLNRLKNCLEKYELPYSTEISLDKLCELTVFDKKCNGDKINIVLCSSVGKSEIKNISLLDFKKFIIGEE